MQTQHRRTTADLSVRDLGKRYANGTWGLRDANFSLAAGKMVAVLGPNGAGKSTLIHMLAGAIEPTEGEITFADPQARIGWSSQRTTIDWYLNVMQNVELGGRLYGFSRAECRRYAQELLEHFHLADLATNDVSMLSGGQQQRIQVARTLMSQPDIMLLDEPTASLDVESSEAVLGLLRDRTRQGALALVSSHDLGLLEQYCDDVLFVLNGEVLTHESMQTFLRRYTPMASVRLTLESEVSPEVLVALGHFDPQADINDSRVIEINLPADSALSDAILAIGNLNRVMVVSSTPVSLRNVYLQLRKEGAK